MTDGRKLKTIELFKLICDIPTTDDADLNARNELIETIIVVNDKSFDTVYDTFMNHMQEEFAKALS